MANYSKHIQIGDKDYYHYDGFDKYNIDKLPNSLIHNYITNIPAISHKISSKYNFKRGDILLYNTLTDTKMYIPVDKIGTGNVYNLDGTQYKIESQTDLKANYVPCGICIVPSNTFINDSKARFMSLKIMAGIGGYNTTKDTSNYSAYQTGSNVIAYNTYSVGACSQGDKRFGSLVSSSYKTEYISSESSVGNINAYSISNNTSYSLYLSAYMYRCSPSSYSSSPPGPGYKEYISGWYVPSLYELYYCGLAKYSNIHNDITTIYNTWGSTYTLAYLYSSDDFAIATSTLIGNNLCYCRISYHLTRSDDFSYHQISVGTSTDLTSNYICFAILAI